MLERGMLALPEINPLVMHTSHDAHALRLGFETCMFKKASHEMRCIIRPHIQPRQTIGRVTQGGIKKIPVQGEKCHAAMLVQQRNNVRVFHPKPGNVSSDEPERNAPLL